MEAKTEVIGTIVMIGETQAVGVKGFKKRPFVINTGGDWPQELEIEMINDNVEKLNLFLPGQQVKVLANIRGRSWKNPEGVIKYFLSLQGWKIEAYNEDQKPVEHPQDASSTGTPPSDGLPF